jgi:hypothetical protein
MWLDIRPPNPKAGMICGDVTLEIGVQTALPIEVIFCGEIINTGALTKWSVYQTCE